jgi:hypothetical protein
MPVYPGALQIIFHDFDRLLFVPSAILIVRGVYRFLMLLCKRIVEAKPFTPKLI